MFFTKQKIKRILDELNKYIYSDSEQVISYKVKKGVFSGGEKKDLDVDSWEDFNSGDKWGGRDQHYWFRTNIEIPLRFEGKTVTFEVKTGREGQWDALNPQFLIYVNGSLIQGLDVNHSEIALTEKAKFGETYSVAMYAYSGLYESMAELSSKIRTLDRDMEKLYFNIKVPYEIAVLLDEEDKRRIDILDFLNKTVNLLDLRKPFSESYYESVIKANEFLESEFYGRYCGDSAITAVCIGHTHIDVAWQWTVSQTREKVARSFSTVLNLMKQYPEYVFMSSQPQLYKFVKEDYPEVYEQIKQRIQEGRWEPDGAMWLEADCNLSSGESLVRQVLFGTRFFEKEFGLKNKILWLPDVFGYSAALPQILKKSGIEYFMTTKISWSEYNKMPYDTFMWKGIDGTEILTHFITTSDYNGVTWQNPNATTYNGEITPSQVMGSWKRYQQKYLNDEVLIAFGYGDGGGGPTKEMLENAKRLEKGIPGSPIVKIGKAADYFDRLADKVAGNPKLPKWVGELYLEYHRGTYTSMARNKKFNRKCEFLYQDAEFLSVLNWIATAKKRYPQEELNKGWELILLNQFHDILPGSSIKEVYDDSKEEYLKIIDFGMGAVNNAISCIAGDIKLESQAIVLFNQLGFIRNDIVELSVPDSIENIVISDADGKVVPVQNTADGKLMFNATQIPAKGFKTYDYKIISDSVKNDSISNGSSINAGSGHMNNKFFEISFDESYNIISIFDKLNKREVIMSGKKANVLQAFEDKPAEYDAWDINIYYSEKMWEVNNVKSVEVVENGPVRAVLQIERRFLDSIIVQKICIYEDIPRIDFVNHIDWKEKQILLKAAFPVDVHAEKAAYDIQYGNVERPTHWNTSWDYARFEVCAHKWADLSEDDFGVSLLNDCKYGHDIKDGMMRLTLLKSAVHPNADADREVHEFTYSLYPHRGGWRNAGTIQMGYALNCPVYVKLENAHDGLLAKEISFIKSDCENVIIEVVKKAEDSDDIIVRLYECYNRRSNVNVTCFKALEDVVECDLMENKKGALMVEGNKFKFTIDPYEIKTFKLKI